MKSTSTWQTALIPAALIAMPTMPALGQTAGCDIRQLQDPAREVLACPNGVTITAEAGAQFELQDRDGAAGPDAAFLQGKALLLETPAGSTGFEVVTPQAIAAVRGTRWAVDVADGKTSVFVVTGRVAVSRGSGGAGVELGPGDGVDVDVKAGMTPLTVRQWGAARVAALLARFGE